MKRLFILLTFVCLSILSFSQNVHEQQIHNETVYLNWKQEYPSQNCNPSFFWSVTRSINVDAYGRYLYKIYVYSNSRYCNGGWAAAYIQGIYLYVDGALLNQNAPAWIMFKETYQPSALSFWSHSYQPNVRFTWTNITVN